MTPFFSINYPTHNPSNDPSDEATHVTYTALYISPSDTSSGAPTPIQNKSYNQGSYIQANLITRCSQKRDTMVNYRGTIKIGIHIETIYIQTRVVEGYISIPGGA